MLALALICSGEEPVPSSWISAPRLKSWTQARWCWHWLSSAQGKKNQFPHPGSLLIHVSNLGHRLSGAGVGSHLLQVIAVVVVAALVDVDVGGADVAAVVARGVLQLLHHGQDVHLQLVERRATDRVT